MSSIFGKCGTAKDKIESDFILNMDDSHEVTLELKHQKKKIKLYGNFDRKNCEMRGTFRASKSLEG